MLPFDPKALYTGAALKEQKRVEINAVLWENGDWTCTVSYFHSVHDQEPFKIEYAPKNVACWLFPDIAQKPGLTYIRPVVQ